MSTPRLVPGAALLLTLLPIQAAGQSAFVSMDRGWLGIEVEQRVSAGPEGEPGDMVIVRVERDSPAERAGLSPGDVLVSFEGAPASMDALRALGERLRPGTPVPVVVRRGGATHTIPVVSSSRPLFVGFDVSEEISVAIESARNQVFRRMDSLLTVNLDSLTIRTEELGQIATVVVTMGDSLRTFRFEGAPWGARSEAPRPAAPRVAPRVVNWGSGPPREERRRAERIEYSFRFVEPGEPYPLEAFLFPSEDADELRFELGRLRDEIERHERLENQRQRDLADRLPVGASRIDTSDELLVELRARLATLKAEATRAQVELTQASRRAMTVRQNLERIRALQPLRLEAAFRAPHLLGQRFVAGAELTMLTDELAEYFDGSEGLLVTQVVERSPADRAGIRPGDVIVRADGGPVRTVNELRAVLARVSGEVEMRVTRRDGTRTVRLPR